MNSNTISSQIGWNIRFGVSKKIEAIYGKMDKHDVATIIKGTEQMQDLLNVRHIHISNFTIIEVRNQTYSY